MGKAAPAFVAGLLAALLVAPPAAAQDGSELAAQIVETFGSYVAVPEGPDGSGPLTPDRLQGLASALPNGLAEKLEDLGATGYFRLFESDAGGLAIAMVLNVRDADLAGSCARGAQAALGETANRVRATGEGGGPVEVGIGSIERQGIEAYGAAFSSGRLCVALFVALAADNRADLEVLVLAQTALTPVSGNPADKDGDSLAYKVGYYGTPIVLVGAAAGGVALLASRKRRHGQPPLSPPGWGAGYPAPPPLYGQRPPAWPTAPPVAPPAAPPEAPADDSEWMPPT